MESKIWRVIGSSVPGRHHDKAGLPCQDAHGWQALAEGRVIAAIADGAGSAPLGSLGATVAVSSALGSLAGAPPPGETPSEALIRAWMIGGVQAARSAVMQAAAGKKAPARDLAATLILVAAAPHWIAAAQIGDGAVAACLGDGDVQTLTRPYPSEYLNETLFLTSEDYLEKTSFALKTGAPGHWAAFSDGLQMLALKMPSGEAFAPFFSPLFRLVDPFVDLVAAQNQLALFLKSPRIAERTDDDLTLVVAGYPK